METYKTVIKHLKNKNKNMFHHINKAGTYFQDAMFIYMADFMAQEMVPDTYDYTKLFGLGQANLNRRFVEVGREKNITGKKYKYANYYP